MSTKRFDGRAAWRCYDEPGIGFLWYVTLAERTPPPYKRQIKVEAIIDLDANGCVAGIEIVDPKMGAPPAASAAAMTTPTDTARYRERAERVHQAIAPMTNDNIAIHTIAALCAEVAAEEREACAKAAENFIRFKDVPMPCKRAPSSPAKGRGNR